MFQRVILNLIIIHGRLNISFTFLGFPKGDTYAHFLQIELAERVISFSSGTTIVFFFYLGAQGNISNVSPAMKSDNFDYSSGGWMGRGGS